MTQEERTTKFIESANKTHGDGRYDYSSVLYIDRTTKVEIICIRHNQSFFQRPKNHLGGQGCPLCKAENTGNRRRETTESFIRKAKIVHGYDKYNYDFVDYVGSSTGVKITCKEHGMFVQTPNSHLNGANCPVCARNAKILRGSHLLKLFHRPARSQEEFIALATEKHNGYYSYEEVVYKNSATKVKVTCPAHGVFTPLPSNHLKGSGCPWCAGNGFAENRQGSIYVLFVDGIYSFTGFGITRNVKSRLRGHSTTLRDNGCFIENDYVSTPLPGYFVKQLETLLKQTFPLAACSRDIPGFKTESTSESYQTVVAFVQNYIAEYNNKQEPIPWQHSTFPVQQTEYA